ncbi:MAG: OmpA family protein [Prevotellaceae bacterium]|jgi:outer membrane protein OmpA-like peptidoglycan-associated protein|nr:OmpA family protein [Prevotellaceae bacterium]
MKKILLLGIITFSTLTFAQEESYKISQVTTDKGGTWGAIPAANGQLIFVDNAANVNKDDIFNSRLYVMERNSKELALPTFAKYEKIGSPYISKDGSEFYFTESGTVSSVLKKGLLSSGTIIHPLQIHISKKGANGEWGEPVPFQHNLATASSGDPCLSPDGEYLYFASDRAGGHGGIDIYRSKRNSDGTWGEPENLGDKINTSGDERFPRFNSKGNLYFSSTTNSTGGLDLFVSTRNGNSFGTPTRLGYPFNSEGDDFAVAFVSDESGYLSSSRTGSDHIYSFEPVKGQIIRDTIKIIEVKKEELVRPDLIFAEMLKNGSLKYTYFDLNKHNIRQSENSKLIDLIIFLRQYPTVELELPSYADCRGENSYNMQLSKKRGDAVKQYLVSTGGIDASRIVVRDFGATNPVSDCDCKKSKVCNESMYQLNRRVEYKILKY